MENFNCKSFDNDNYISILTNEKNNILNELSAKDQKLKETQSKLYELNNLYSQIVEKS